jgi:hypothetical protein
MDDLQTSSLRFGGVVIHLLAQPGRPGKHDHTVLLSREGHSGGYSSF